MGQSILNTAVIKAKSEELQIPFANLAVAFVTEEFLVRISESEYAPYLWMKNTGNFRLDYYKRKIADSPVFYYQRDPAINESDGKIPGQKMDPELAELMMMTLCQDTINQNINWKYHILEKEGSYIVDITVLLDNIRIPFQIKIEVYNHENLFPNQVRLRLCIRNNDQITLNAYPVELAAADCIFEIMEKLELISDMSSYLKLHSILKKQTLDGRKVQLQLLDKYEKRGIKPRQQSMSILLGYTKYSYMKKKWKTYLKSENKKTPEWEEVLNTMGSFLSPIWEMLCSDMIFIGDWMPELSRFLE